MAFNRCEVQTGAYSLIITLVSCTDTERDMASNFTMSLDWDKPIADDLYGTVEYSCEEDQTEQLKVSFMLYSDSIAVMDKINEFKKMVYRYNGRRHEPSALKIDWGSELIFSAMMSSFGHLFRPILFNRFRFKVVTRLILSGFKLLKSGAGLNDCFALSNRTGDVLMTLKSKNIFLVLMCF